MTEFLILGVRGHTAEKVLLRISTALRFVALDVGRVRTCANELLAVAVFTVFVKRITEASGEVVAASHR